MGKPWETYKLEIYHLYIEEGRPLAEVREILKLKYNFEACKRSYQNQIEVWGFKKNVRSADMRAYLEQKQNNIPDEQMGLSQDIIDKITPRKVRRYEKRYAGKSSPSHDGSSSRDGRRPEDFDATWDYDQAPFDYSYPVTPSNGSEDQFYTSDMLSSFPSYPQERVAYSAAIGHDAMYSSANDYSSLATEYTYPRSSNEAQSRYSPSHAPPHPSSGLNQTAGSIELMKAALAGRPDITSKLLMDGEDPNVADRDGNTSLHYLARGFHRILDRAANAPGLLSGNRSVGTSATFDERITAYNNCLDLLLGHGAYLSANNKGETAAQMATARLARYTDDPFNAAAGVHKEWISFVDTMTTTATEYPS